MRRKSQSNQKTKVIHKNDIFPYLSPSGREYKSDETFDWIASYVKFRDWFVPIEPDYLEIECSSHIIQKRVIDKFIYLYSKIPCVKTMFDFKTVIEDIRNCVLAIRIDAEELKCEKTEVEPTIRSIDRDLFEEFNELVVKFNSPVDKSTSNLSELWSGTFSVEEAIMDWRERHQNVVLVLANLERYWETVSAYSRMVRTDTNPVMQWIKMDLDRMTSYIRSLARWLREIDFMKMRENTLKLFKPSKDGKVDQKILSVDDRKEGEYELFAEIVYGMVHASYVLTAPGLWKIARKFHRVTYGYCPRRACDRCPVLPVGQSDEPDVSPVKVFCPLCHDIYEIAKPIEQREHNFDGLSTRMEWKEILILDGACFGTSLPGLFMLSFPMFATSSVYPEKESGNPTFMELFAKPSVPRAELVLKAEETVDQKST